MTTRPIHAPASSADDSDEDVLEISSISGVMQIVAYLTIAGKATETEASPIHAKSRRLPD